VIEAAREARVVTPLERDAKHLKGAIALLAVREVEGDLRRGGGSRGRRLRSLGGTRRIIVVTDGALAQPTPLAAAGIPTEVRAVGDAPRTCGRRPDRLRSGVDPRAARAGGRCS